MSSFVLRTTPRFTSYCEDPLHHSKITMTTRSTISRQFLATAHTLCDGNHNLIVNCLSGFTTKQSGETEMVNQKIPQQFVKEAGNVRKKSSYR
jgi:hypothetical protein